MLKVALSDNPPAHLLLGSDAVRLVEEKIEIAAGRFRGMEKRFALHRRGSQHWSNSAIK